MRKLSIMLSLLVSSVFLNTIHAQHKVTVEIGNFKSNKGKVIVALYDKYNFRKKPLFRKSMIVKDFESTVVFENVPKGEYSINCFHDANENRKMDFSPNGRPIESWGVSNVLSNLFRAPVFEDGKVTIDVDKTIPIKLL